MWNNYGFVFDIFNVFKKYNVDVNIINTSQFNISTTTDESCIETLNYVIEELKDKYHVEFSFNNIIISLVSDKIRKCNLIGKIFEITERLDEDVARINPLGGHYVWLLKAKRFEYSFEPGVSGEAVNQQVFDDLKNPAVSGADKPYNQNVTDSSKKIFDYSKTDYGGVYGGY
jgi:hypothetical protein